MFHCLVSIHVRSCPVHGRLIELLFLLITFERVVQMCVCVLAKCARLKMLKKLCSAFGRLKQYESSYCAQIFTLAFKTHKIGRFEIAASSLVVKMQRKKARAV